MSLKDFFDSCDDHTEVTHLDKNCMVVEWSRRGIGFGSFTFTLKNGKFRCDNECMSRGFVKDVMRDLMDKVILEDER